MWCRIFWPTYFSESSFLDELHSEIFDLRRPIRIGLLMRMISHGALILVEYAFLMER